MADRGEELGLDRVSRFGLVAGEGEVVLLLHHLRDVEAHADGPAIGQAAVCRLDRAAVLQALPTRADGSRPR